VTFAPAVVVEPFSGDAVAITRCILIDADAFPYASVEFGLGSSSSRLLVAREYDGGPIVGFVAGRVRRGCLHIEGLAVERTWRRRGIGRALVRAAVARARAEGLAAVTLHVGTRNAAAIALYRAEGFETIQCLRGFYSARAFGSDRDAYQMSARLG
jgi:ribosomal protein S18 acetylase RimI-like enzyme